MTTQNQSKPFTGNFQLQTKIRQIIQQVLTATIRKLSVFHQKIDKFEDYFMVYKQKVQTLQKSCAQNKSFIMIQSDQRLKSRKQNATHMIRAQQLQQKNNIRFDQIHNEVGQMGKVIKQIQRQNENLNSQFSKTKVKFLQYSDIISGLKQYVSWKITKYVEQTADTNTQIKINSEQLKKQHFNLMLMLDRQKQKYDKIIQMNENDQNNTKRIFQDISRLQLQNVVRLQQNKKTLDKLQQYDTILQSKIKTIDNKYQFRISQLQKDNIKFIDTVKTIQTFTEQIQNIKQEIQKNNIQIIKKIQDINKKTKDQIQIQFLKLSKQSFKLQKTLQKKFTQVKQANQKSQDFLTQKIDFMKMEIQSQIYSRTSQLMKQKQDSSKVNQSTMDQINGKLNKFNMQIHKQMIKVQNNIREVKSQLKKQIDNFMETVQTKIQSIDIKPQKTSQDQQEGIKISPQLLSQIQQFSIKINSIQQRLNQKDKQISEIKQNQGKTQIFQKDMLKKIDIYFKQQQQTIGTKVQKIMFLVTKMRGDGIIRNQFIEKQIKQIKKNFSEYKNYTDTILKLMPAFGQCINLILALIYDAEYQHSKIIQDNLPLLKKDQQKFNTCLQGVLYQYKQKKKPGVICYRHKEFKKTQIVKDTFNAYIKVWQQLFENQFKNKNQFLPKDFYKKAVQKVVNNKIDISKQQKRQTSLEQIRQKNYYDRLANTAGFTKPLQPNNYRRQQTQQKQMSQSVSNNGFGSLGQMASREAAKSLKRVEQEEKIKQTINSRQGNGNENNLNGSFNIRKKKTVKKDQVIVMNIISPGQ